MTFDNPLRAAVERGETVFGATATSKSPVLVDVYGGLGLDFVWFDFEHSGGASGDAATFARLRRAATAAGIEPVVRLESGEPSLVRKALDAGLRNLVIPRVETAAEVERAVRASRFDYDGAPGDRGTGTGLANAWGDRGADYTDREDGTAFVGVMLENETALENVDDILAVPELGFGWLGPSDLSVSLGHPLAVDEPTVREAIRGFREAFHDAGVPVGIGAYYAGGVEAGIDDGYSFLNLGSETGAARAVLGERLSAARDLTAE